MLLGKLGPFSIEKVALLFCEIPSLRTVPSVIGLNPAIHDQVKPANKPE